jgi:raffinose/stachyose/melibiose transport system permease protein
VLSTIAVLTIVGSWNAFLLPLLVLTKPEQWTLPLGINNISAQYVTDTAMILAYTTVAMVPALIFYFLAQKQIVSGLTSGGVKG